MHRDSGRPLALVSAASGIGDIVRITPLVRVFSQLGYEVDVLLAPDYLESVELVAGAPEIGRLFVVPTRWCRDQRRSTDGLDSRTYDVATFTTLSAPYRPLVRARREWKFDAADWRRAGDSACVERIARAAGWTGPLPPPFALASDRRFDLAPGTLALHAGCKPGWPWKKWHGFAELAALLPYVVLVGTPQDLDNEGTYFVRPFAWPPHVRSFVGQLGLRDTAALLRDCAALVTNDSGLMHVAVALGVPTFGVFGITSPLREAIPAPQMHPITKGLPCEPGCREQPWGRRDCCHHLECLRSLSAAEVLAAIRAVLPFSADEPAFEAAG